MKFTIFTGNPSVAKGYGVKDGALIKLNAENFYHGNFETVDISPDGLSIIVKGLKPGQFITAGVHKTFIKGKCPKDATRSIEDFTYPEGSGMLIIDADSLHKLGVKDVSEFVKSLRSLDKAFDNVALVCSPSASSNIIFDGSNTGLRGLHCFIPVDNAKEIPKILDTLHMRSVLAGYGRAEVTANGKVLIKSLVDLAMKSSNQPCFEGGARLLEKKITQDREISSYAGGQLPVSKITPITAKDRLEFEDICTRLKAPILKLAEKKRSEWVAKRIDEMVENGSSKTNAIEVIDRALNGGDLYGEYVIHTDKQGCVTVTEILANPTKFHEQTCADPVDPEYGQNKAKIYCKQDKPCINSLAHGGNSRYFLYNNLFEDLTNDIASNLEIGTLFESLVLRDEHVSKMSEAEFLIPNMIVRGHVAAYVAPGNGGKTAIFVYLCEKLSAKGLKVFYINVDGSPSDLKRHHAHAKLHNYQVIAPDACDGKSAADVIEIFKSMIQSNQRCDDYVFILDTLKKFTDVIDKRQSKELYNLMRALTVKGATVCLLGHCNKYNDSEGGLVYEGTADLRNDLDELIYLKSSKNESKNILEITTRPDKVRAEFLPISFVIDFNNNRQVSMSDSVLNIFPPEEHEFVENIKDAIANGKSGQTEIIAWVKERSSAGDKKIRDRLKRYSTGENRIFESKSTGLGKGLCYSIYLPFEDFTINTLV